MAGKFIVSRRSNGDFQFVLCASNGQTILVSEGYSTREGCLNGIESVRVNAGDATRFEKRVSADGRPYFVLKAGNHQVIGQSQMYSGDDTCDNGMASVGNHATDALIVED
jgi:uncharacterized protein YegP (UPF0339 family)